MSELSAELQIYSRCQKIWLFIFQLVSRSTPAWWVIYGSHSCCGMDMSDSLQLPVLQGIIVPCFFTPQEEELLAHLPPFVIIFASLFFTWIHRDLRGLYADSPFCHSSTSFVTCFLPGLFYSVIIYSLSLFYAAQSYDLCMLSILSQKKQHTYTHHTHRILRVFPWTHSPVRSFFKV